METKNAPERILFTFQSNGEIDGKRMVEATAEHLAIHEAPVGAAAGKRSWFGAEDALGKSFACLGFTQLDVEGVLSTLRVNKVSTREVEVQEGDLDKMGFAPSA